jgi:uncharacterized membrane protein
LLEISDDSVRVFLHVLAATVWVGGPLTVLVLLPALREIGDDAPLAALFLGVVLQGG